ncbi:MULTISPECIES: iron-sulfur cluster assembly accessory protein [unclassified Mesorhizobium]|uniref:HesB/IscA family protein n=1 Tax=unclassified Mesorhizobium TaxID=325217 RepID=UPI000F7648D0|nr:MULTISPECIES: iron-sulfur cluster assembly accessory protein [unclassified Mesorhizobium]AZO19315.1 iron-sulfur cluster assembly accessory protein [Mesorhizobium sp. M1E.F.Ca.ET.045.02.1.1]RUW30405.1 iron-sulfur cluster assembly accessory protein [Mesorhizobium sp. M1E.F.Ca.ET.041.01.1.1]RWD90854.1 MAG: iron-sulfur cluster assembly accessory protein [Mesorhizobium sp.]RWD92195.1 MAG: iron-sulfur cluster assembly accessory protein [Mesorhizobium sp.]TIV50425.1 MAG: iron-sulfur cluster assemb
MITLTENAVTAVKTALSRAAEPAEGLRIMVEAGGCAGLKYLMGLESASRDGDAVIEADGIKVYVDAGSQPHVAGMTVDFVTGLESSGFVFDNPNAQDKCACGKSFG